MMPQCHSSDVNWRPVWGGKGIGCMGHPPFRCNHATIQGSHNSTLSRRNRSRCTETKKPSPPAKWRIKASSCAAENCLVAWPHPSLGGEAPRSIGADENSQIVILTPDSKPPSRLPIRLLTGRTVAVGVCGPLQWRYRPRFSRGSQTSDCRDRAKQPPAFKERKTSYAR